MRDAHHHQSLGCEAEGIKTGTMRRAAFGECHLLGNPENALPIARALFVIAGSRVRSQSQSKAGRCRNMGLPQGRDFVQGTARKTTAKHRINGRDAEGQDGGTSDPNHPLQGEKTLAQLRHL